MPTIMARLLDQAWFVVLARVLLTFVFWGSGLSKVIHFSQGVADMQAANLPYPALMNIAVVITQLVGSALIILNWNAWIGAGALAVFTALTIPLVHHFWSLPEPQAMIAFRTATEHVTVIGALTIATILSRSTGKAGNGSRRQE